MIAVFTPEELQTLHTMAVDYNVTRMGGRLFTDSIFYRNKPAYYFQNISTNNKNIMTVYGKDNNGDPASIINGQIDGLFFATRNPENISHFGDRRVTIPATAMLTADSNLYFADFYCNRRAHYVTVVLTRPGSDTDRFCESNLIKLNITDNEFLKRSCNPGEACEVRVTIGVWVEVLYTEDVDLSRPECTFSTVRSTGTSRPGGLPKNPNCRVCNLPNRRTVLVERNDEMSDSLRDLFRRIRM